MQKKQQKSVKVRTRKSTANKVVGVRISDDVLRKLEALAEKTERTVQYWIRRYVADGLAQEKHL